MVAEHAQNRWALQHGSSATLISGIWKLPIHPSNRALFKWGIWSCTHWCTWLCFSTSWPEFTGPVPRLYQNGISPWKEARNMTPPRTEWCLMLLIRRTPLDPRERRAGVDVQQLRFIMTCLSLAIQPRRTDLFGEKMSIKVQSDFNHTSLLLSKVKAIVLSALVEFHRRRCSAVNLMNL